MAIRNQTGVMLVQFTKTKIAVNKYLTLNAFFNFSALKRKQGSDRIAISLFQPKDKEQHQEHSSVIGQAQSTNNKDFNNFSKSDNFTF